MSRNLCCALRLRAAFQPLQFAVKLLHVRFPLRYMAALRTGKAASRRDHKSAFLALARFLHLRFGDCLAAIIQFRVNYIIHEAQAQGRVAVIQDQTPILARCRPQPPANNLRIKDFRLRWPRQTNALHIPINARCQRADVADHFQVTAGEPSGNLTALARLG